VQKGNVVQAGMAPGGVGARLLVQDEDVAVSSAERCLASVAPVCAQPEGALVPGERTIEVGDDEVRRAEAQRRRERGSFETLHGADST
jgi:hypothetical protein